VKLLLPLLLVLAGLQGCPAQAPPEAAEPPPAEAGLALPEPVETTVVPDAVTVETAGAVAEIPEGLAEAAAAQVEEPAPVVVKSAEQIACEKKKGEWRGNGKGGFLCTYRTRDSGKSCRKSADCEGYCLARSRTCAPVRPLLGCVAVLTQNGVPAEICLE
jgi:hypothetical protein